MIGRKYFVKFHTCYEIPGSGFVRIKTKHVLGVMCDEVTETDYKNTSDLAMSRGLI